MRASDFGAAPVWRDTSDGAYTIPAGFKCIGFFAEGAGTVNFTSAGTAVTPSVQAGVMYPAQVDSFQASPTATGIHACLVKG